MSSTLSAILVLSTSKMGGRYGEVNECPHMDIPAWISMWISTLVWIIIED